MKTDDLDFFLLDVVSKFSIGLTNFDSANIGEALNKRVPHYSRPELIAALAELFSNGDLEAEVKSTQGRRYRGLRLNPEEIEASLAGALKSSYSLTPQGGKRWLEVSNVDWSRWDDDCWSTLHTGQITTASREFTEFLLEREIRSCRAHTSATWRELRPWKPTYWHEERLGYQVRYRIKSNENSLHNFNPYVWAEPLTQDELAKTSQLAPRRRRALPKPSRSLEGLTATQLEKHSFTASPQRRFAAETERSRRASSAKELIDRLRFICPISRYCACKELGKRKAKEAVPSLLALAFETHDSEAFEALGNISDEYALEPLLTLFEYGRRNSPSWNSNYFAALERAIIQFGDPAITRIEDLFAASRVSLHRVLRILARSNSPRAIQFMEQHMRTQWFVMEEMARMGIDAQALLFEVANNSNESKHDRRKALRALSEARGPFQKRALKHFAALPPGVEHFFLSRAAELLAKKQSMPIPDTVKALIPLLGHPNCGHRRIAVDLLAGLDARETSDAIARLATDEEWQVRASVARALTKWGEPIQAIEKLRQDPDIIVRGCTKWFGHSAGIAKPNSRKTASRTI